MKASSLQAFFWVTGNIGIQIFQQSCQNEETMKDYLYKLYPARLKIKCKPMKQTPVESVPFMNKVLQFVFTVSELHFWTQEQINEHAGLAPLLFREARSPQRNSGKSYICEADEALPLTPKCFESRLLSMNWGRRKCCHDLQKLVLSIDQCRFYAEDFYKCSL